MRIAIALLLFLLPQSLQAAEVKVTPDVVYGHKDGMALTFDVFRPAKPNGAGVLFMMSGGWVSRWSPPANIQNFFKPFLDEGFTMFAVRHGSSPRFGIPDAVSDVRRSVRYIRHHAKRFGVDADLIGAMGISSGGHLALMLGTTGDDGNPNARDAILRTGNRLAAVVAFVPPTDLRVAIWDAPDSLPAYRNFPALNLDKIKAATHSPLLHASKDDAPILMVAGDKDALVPIFHSEKLHAALQEKKATSSLIVLEGAGHGFQGEDLQKAMQASLKWFKKYTVAPPKP